MKRRSIKDIVRCVIPACTLGGVVAFAAAANDPRPAPAASVPTPPPVSEPYKILLNRTMFSRDRGRSAAWAERAAAERAAADRAAAIAATQPGGPRRFGAGSPEASLALKGVTLEDGVFIAFIEDNFAHETRRVHAGEAIARGQISAMSLDGIEYDAGGKPLRIGIGQTLDGATPPPSSLPPSSSPQPGAWPAATAGDTSGRDRSGGGRGSRDGDSSGPRDFRSREARDGSPDRGAPSADRGGPAPDQKTAATDAKPAGSGQPDVSAESRDSGFPPDGFGPP